MAHDPVAPWAPEAGGSGGRSHHPPPTTAAPPPASPGKGAVAASQHFPHRGPSGASRAEPVLITEAEPSQAEQTDARKRRYLITMGIRMASLIAAALTYQVSVWLMAVFAILGTVLPWIAVVMANDGPPKKRVDVNRYTPPRPDRILESGTKARVIDM
jgi:hypothetical protein